MITYPLASNTWDASENEAIQKVIESGMFTMGKYVNQFELDFAKYFNSKYAIMVNSGSSANLIAVASLFYRKNSPLKRGDEIIVPAVSWSTSYHPLHQFGLKLKFVDIDLQTLNYNTKALETAVTKNTRAILAVNLLGNPNDFSEIERIIGNNDILIIEDNCESMGASYRGKKTGTFGLLGTFSTFFSHHISTMEGGIVITDDEELYHIMLSLRSHGWTRHLPKINKVTGIKSDNEFEESYKFVLPGYNVRPGEINAAIGVEQMKKLTGFIETRRQNAQVFVEHFKNNQNIIIQKEIGMSSWFGFSLIIKPNAKITREELISFFLRNGVECRPIVSGNFTKNEVLKYYNYELHGEMKNAEYLDKNGLFIGNHHFSIANELIKMKDLIEKI